MIQTLFSRGILVIANATALSGTLGVKTLYWEFVKKWREIVAKLYVACS